MRKFKLIVPLLLLLLLVSCDYQEKSFQALNIDDIPSAVTMDFELPKGMYGLFVWTSNRDEVIKIVDARFAKVIQQDEDVDVTLTARIYQTVKDFPIKVLKSGSEPTLLEQSVIIFNNLSLPNEIITPFEVVTKVENFYLEYSKSDTNLGHYQIITKHDGSVWIVPEWLSNGSYDQIIFVKAFYQTNDTKLEYINNSSFHFRIGADRDGSNEYRKVFEQLVIGYAEKNRQGYVTEDFTLPLTSTINEKAIISWTSQDNTTISISEDGKIAHVTQKDKIWSASLVATITIDEITYRFIYNVTVFPSE